MWREEVRKWGLRPWLYWLNAGFLYSTFFLTVSQVKKKLGWGKKLALKIWNGRHFVRFTCFLFCSSEKFGQQIFLWRFHEIFFYRFCCQNFQWLSRHHYTHRKQQYGCGERSELHCASHSYSQQKYTLGLPDRKIFINVCFSLYTVACSKTGMLKHIICQSIRLAKAW